MFNILTIDLEDYFQVHAFSNVVRFEDWGNYKSRIEPNTHRLLEILEESGIGHRAEGIGNELSPCASRLTPYVSGGTPQSPALSPQSLDSAPCSMPYAPCGPPKATFFILAWLAERYPHLIRTIKEQGHEIACHGYAHKLIYTQTKEEFREDIKKAKAILEDIAGDEVIGYRAPSYSITEKSKWALEVLMEEGFKYDSSIFPIHHDFYGFPHAPRFPFVISTNGDCNFRFQISDFKLKETQSSVPGPLGLFSINSINSTNSINSSNSSNPSNPSNPNTPNSELRTPNLNMQHLRTAAQQHFPSPNASRLAPNGSLMEFPLSTVRFCGQNVPVSGGGYFRLFPYQVIKKGLKKINKIEGMPFIFYLHPWELDEEQPRIDSISMLSRFRHYLNLHKTEERFKNLLNDFNFSSIREVINSLAQQTQVTQ